MNSGTPPGPGRSRAPAFLLATLALLLLLALPSGAFVSEKPGPDPARSSPAPTSRAAASAPSAPLPSNAAQAAPLTAAAFVPGARPASTSPPAATLFQPRKPVGTLVVEEVREQVQVGFRTIQIPEVVTETVWVDEVREDCGYRWKDVTEYHRAERLSVETVWKWVVEQVQVSVPVPRVVWREQWIQVPYLSKEFSHWERVEERVPIRYWATETRRSWKWVGPKWWQYGWVTEQVRVQRTRYETRYRYEARYRTVWRMRDVCLGSFPVVEWEWVTKSVPMPAYRQVTQVVREYVLVPRTVRKWLYECLPVTERVQKTVTRTVSKSVQVPVYAERVVKRPRLDIPAGSGDKDLEALRMALDLAGFLPGVGVIADLGSAGISAWQGDWSSAALSAISAFPGFGDLVAAGRIGVRGYEAARLGDGVTALVRRSGKVWLEDFGADASLPRTSGYRDRLKKLTGWYDVPSDVHAHHLFPAEFGKVFQAADIDFNAAEFLTWAPADLHMWGHRYNHYNLLWEDFLMKPRSRQEILDYGRSMAKDYGLETHY